MNLKYSYWYFKSALPEKFCNDLVKYGNEKTEEIALTGGFQEKIEKNNSLSDDELKDLKKKRDSNIVWLSEPWIYNEIHPYIHQANKALVGIFNGIIQRLVSLQNINKINIMVGIAILGTDLMLT